MLYDLEQPRQEAHFGLIQVPACDYDQTITVDLLDQLTSEPYSVEYMERFITFDSLNGNLTIYTDDRGLMNNYTVNISGTTSEG